MNCRFFRSTSLVVVVLLLALGPQSARATDRFVAPGGRADGSGTKDSPWDLESAINGRQKVAPGDTIWVLAGVYTHPNRGLESAGYAIRLAGTEGKPIHIRAMPGQRVTIDGGLTVLPPSEWIWVRDFEILVSENATVSRTLNEPGSHPKSYGRPWGGLNVQCGKGCKYIHLVIHDNAQAVSFWSGATDSEIYGCILYDNGWKAPDRGHGHAIYTQNKDGVKTIENCIMTGGYSYTMHAYGSKNAYVDGYLIRQNICYDAGRFLIGGGRPSHNIRVLGNFLYNVGMQLGYNAPSNEDCEVRDNVIVNGDLQINKFKSVDQRDNQVVGRGATRPLQPARVIVQPSRYDAGRAHVAIFNWGGKPTSVELPMSMVQPLAKTGDTVRLMNPRDLFGKPIAVIKLEGNPITVPVEKEFAAMVLMRIEP